MRDAVVLVGEADRAVRVLAVSPLAAKAGVRVGVTLASARALLPRVLVEWVDREGERADLKALSAQLGRVSPRVDVLPPDAIGAALERWPQEDARAGFAQEREQAAIDRVADRLKTLGHTARIVVADDLLGARAVAVWSPQSSPFPRWLAPGTLSTALASLPIQALGLPVAVEDTFRTLGVDTVEALAKLPPAAIRDRFGAAASRAHARARGCFALRRLPVLPEHPPFWRQESLPFPADTVEA